MKKRLSMLIMFMFLSFGCYVSTSIEADRTYLPADFSAPVLVVAVQDTVGMQKGLLAELEEGALEALSEKGIQSINLYEAVGDADETDAIERLKSKEYRALLRIVINQWGSKTEILQDPVPTYVGDSDAGPASGSTFRPPTAIDSGQMMPGPEAEFKAVAMEGSLTDLQTDRLIWSGRVDAKPALVGRSFIYRNFNRNIEYRDLARRCFNKLAKELDRLLPKDS